MTGRESPTFDSHRGADGAVPSPDGASYTKAGEAGTSVGPVPSSAEPRPFLTEDDWRARRRLVGVQDIVDGLMTKIGGGRGGPGAMLSASWNDIVGSEYAERTRPGSCASGRLVVLVADGATASKLRFMTTQIMQNAADLVGDGVVDRISFKVTPGLKP